METPDDIGKADSEGGKGFRVSALPLGVDGGCGLRFHAGTGVADGDGDSFADADGDLNDYRLTLAARALASFFQLSFNKP